MSERGAPRTLSTIAGNSPRNSPERASGAPGRCMVKSRDMESIFHRCVIAVLVLAAALVPDLRAQSASATASDPRVARLESLLGRAIHQTLAQFGDKALKPEQL